MEKATSCRGQEHDRPEAEQPDRRWYGWQVLLADAAAGSIFATTAVADDPFRPMFAGVAVWTVGAPGVHFAHGNVKQGFGSLGLRIALPVLGMGVAWDAGCGDYDSVFCGPEIFVSIAVGGLAAMTLDAALLAWETAPQKTPRAQSTFRLTPVLDVRRRRGLAGVTGRF